MLNPLRHHIKGFDMFVTERYGLTETTSHFSILGLLALCKTANALNIQEDEVIEAMRSMVPTLAYVLCDQTAMDIACHIGQVQQPVPMLKREWVQPASIVRSNHDHVNEKEEGWPSQTVIDAMRATYLRRIGCQVKWSVVELEPFPEDWDNLYVEELEGFDVDACSRQSQQWPMVKTLARFCCFRY